MTSLDYKFYFNTRLRECREWARGIIASIILNDKKLFGLLEDSTRNLYCLFSTIETYYTKEGEDYYIHNLASAFVDEKLRSAAQFNSFEDVILDVKHGYAKWHKKLKVYFKEDKTFGRRAYVNIRGMQLVIGNGMTVYESDGVHNLTCLQCFPYKRV